MPKSTPGSNPSFSRLILRAEKQLENSVARVRELTALVKLLKESNEDKTE